MSTTLLLSAKERFSRTVTLAQLVGSLVTLLVALCAPALAAYVQLQRLDERVTQQATSHPGPSAVAAELAGVRERLAGLERGVQDLATELRVERDERRHSR